MLPTVPPPVPHPRRSLSTRRSSSGGSSRHQAEKEQARAQLQQKIYVRRASLTPAEAFFLHALLIDEDDDETPEDASNEPLAVQDDDVPPPLKQPPDGDDDDDHDHDKKHVHVGIPPEPTVAALSPYPEEKELEEASAPVASSVEAHLDPEQIKIRQIEHATKVLSDEMLFTVPPGLDEHTATNNQLTTSEESATSSTPSWSITKPWTWWSQPATASSPREISTHLTEGATRAPPEMAHPPAHRSHHKTRRPTILGLWQAHQDGVPPKALAVRGSLSWAATPEEGNGISSTTPPAAAKGKPPPLSSIKIINATAVAEATSRSLEIPDPSEPLRESSTLGDDPHDNNNNSNNSNNHQNKEDSQGLAKTAEEEDEDELSADSDEEVRRDPADDLSEGSSWAEDDHVDHFNSWQVLKDEYAQDFGFDYAHHRVSMTELLQSDSSHLPNTFHILGTSADDKSAQPHVLSPPLMDALMNSLPVILQGQNFWLKYSLIRDGASLETLKRYVRAAPYTILAVETPQGQVFGSFTSSPWRNHLGLFGSQPAFVWKMRHGRRTPCGSLFDQAQLETEIDVYPFRGIPNLTLIQVCRRNQLAVGGDESMPSLGEYDTLEEALNQAERTGFALCLDDNLTYGTTSPSASFKSPSLLADKPDDRMHRFEIAGLEVWTLTPCMDVAAAEKLEMTKFFVEESLRSTQMGSTLSVASETPSLHSRKPSDSSYMSSPKSGTGGSSGGSTLFTSQDLDRDKFYRRVGQDWESQERRQRWEHINTMGEMSSTATSTLNDTTGPRYGYSNR